MTDRMNPDMADVDARGTAKLYAELMRALDAEMRPRKQRLLALLDPRPGQRVLDVGCGAGADLVELARRVMPGGVVVGVDSSRQLLAEAERAVVDRGLPIDLRHGDARKLDFPDGSFDRTRAERVLQHLDRPEAAVAEMVRVTGPGGIVLLVDADYGMLLLDSDDVEVTRAVQRRRADAAPSGRIGRRLGRLLLTAGLVDVEVEGDVMVWTDHDLAMKALDLAAAADAAAADGELSRERVEAWKAELAERGRKGEFFMSTGGFRARGRVAG